MQDTHKKTKDIFGELMEIRRIPLKGQKISVILEGFRRKTADI